jgi:hypothetical protein
MSKTTKPKQQKNAPSARPVKSAATASNKNKPSKLTMASESASPVRENSKLASVIALLRRREGATLEQMMKSTGWQAHSVRGAMSGAIGKSVA